MSSSQTLLASFRTARGRADGPGERALLRAWLVGAAAGWTALLLAPSCPGQARPAPRPAAESPAAALATYRSRHFAIHTDLPSQDARRLLNRLEATLQGAVRYWGRPPRGVVQCYVAGHVEQWPDSALPHAMTRIYIGGIGGATLWKRPPAGRRGPSTAIIYASDRHGVAEHESVHAYCMQTFGNLGPAWYKEGMAEMAYYASLSGTDDSELARTIAFLRKAPSKSLEEVLQENAYTSRIARSLETIRATCAERYGPGWRAPLDLWTPEDTEAVEAARRTYRWAWALCRMLAKNPNYAPRFRLLGQSYLNGGDDTFERAFGAVKQKLAFEYRFFLQRIDPAYRIDLCAWDWSTPFRRLPIGGTASATVEASRGYQASGLILREGESYSYRSEGAWRTGPQEDAANADGVAEARGRLTGVLLDDFELSRPFPLGVSGRFTAPGPGRLYLRCEEDWGALADNQGRVVVRFRREDAPR